MGDLYKKRYGDWAGNPAGHAPDLSRCCVELMDRFHPGGYRCSRKRGHGPDGAYCKQHDPAAVAARQKKASDKYYTELARRKLEWAGPRFFAILEKIANGHNDPRSLAQEAIAPYLTRQKEGGEDG